jgi:HSP20 family molecular chaperone IbpA
LRPRKRNGSGEGFAAPREVAMSEKLRINANVCSCLDRSRERMTVEICIPGVKRDAIRLEMNSRHLQLLAPRTDFEYVTSAAFCQPVKAEAATARYHDGLLRIEVPLEGPPAEARRVTIQ